MQLYLVAYILYINTLFNAINLQKILHTNVLRFVKVSKGSGMCKEVFEIVQKMDLSKVETRLALQCAPVIMGIKLSNLLIILSKDEKEVSRIFEGTGLIHYRLLRQKDRTIYLLFQKSKMDGHLKKKQVRQLLAEKGYMDFSLAGILRTFQRRYEDYINKKADFPHEMGLLLGYPIEDVRGFIENNGKNYIYTGYWKVYADLEEKKRIFDAYESAKEELIIFLSKYL